MRVLQQQAKTVFDGKCHDASRYDAASVCGGVRAEVHHRSEVSPLPLLGISPRPWKRASDTPLLRRIARWHFAEMAGRARFVGAAVLLSLDQPIRAISLRRSPAPNQAVRAASLTVPIYSASGVVTGNPGAGFDMVGLQLNRVNVTCSCNAIARITGYPRCRVILLSCRELYMCHVTD